MKKLKVGVITFREMGEYVMDLQVQEIKLHGMGPKAMELIRQALEEKGLSFIE